MPWQYSGGYALVSEVMAAVVADLEGSTFSTLMTLFPPVPLSSSTRLNRHLTCQRQGRFLQFIRTPDGSRNNVEVICTGSFRRFFNHYNLRMFAGLGRENPQLTAHRDTWVNTAA